MKKRKIAIGIASLAGGVFLSANAFGQVLDPVDVNITLVDPKFFIAILAGVLIALGFQMLLTNLSVAAGITAAGNLQKKSGKNNSKSDKSDAKERSMPLGVIFTSAAGGWTMITAAISLFFASLFAVKLSLVADNAIGVTLGLVIWAVFMGVMLYLESKAIGSVVSGLFGTAFRAVKAGFTGTGNLFHKSESTKMKNVAENTIDKIKEEVYDIAESSDLKNKFENFLDKVQPKPMDMEKLKDEMASLINEISIEEKQGEHPGEKEIFLKVAEKQPHLSKHEVSRLSQFFDVAKSAMKIAGVLGVAGGAAGIAGTVYTKDRVEKIKRDTENSLLKLPYLRPEIIHAELEEIFNNEKNVQNLNENKKQLFDKEYVAAMVAAQKNVSRDEALMTAYKVEEALNDILRKSNISEIAGSKAEQLKDQVVDSIASKKDEVLSGIEERIERFFQKINRPELDYNSLKADFEFLLHNPKETPEVLRRKLKQMDKNTLIGLIGASEKYSKSDAENMVHKFEEVKENILKKLDQVEENTKTQLNRAKEYALEQAENTRKTAMSASWWLFATLVLSGLAAALGGMATL